MLEHLLDHLCYVTGGVIGFVGEVHRENSGDGSVRLIAARGPGAPAVRAAAWMPHADPPEIDPGVRELIEEVIRTGRAVIVRDFRIRASDGAEVGPETVDYFGLPCHHLGKVVGILGLAFRPGECDPALAPLVPTLLLTCGHLIESERQNSRRREAEEALAQSERELADFFENAPVGLHWIGPEGRILRANRAELALLGYSREEFVGRHISEFHEKPEIARMMLDLLRAGETFDDVEVSLRARDGSFRRVRLSADAFREADRILHARCMLRDVSQGPQSVQ